MNILLTSAGRRTYLINYFKEALTNKGLVHASNSIFTYSLTQADKYVITPNIYDCSYIDSLKEYCLTNEITVIISLFDIDLPILAKHKKEFMALGIHVVVSDLEITETCNDKWATFLFLEKIGLKQTKSFITLDTTVEAINNNTINFPLILKPRWGMGSIGIYKADTLEELYVFYKKLHREIFNTYLKYESEVDKEAAIIIQETIKGQEYGIEILNDLNGNYITTIAKKKVAMRAGETDIAEIVNSEPFLNTSQLLAKKLHHVGNLDVDCFITPNGEIIVLEMNNRFGGQYPFSHNAGVNFPKQIIEWLSNGKTQEEYITPKIGTRSCKDLTPVIF